MSEFNDKDVDVLDEMREFNIDKVDQYLEEMNMNKDEFMDYMKQVMKNLGVHIERIKEEADHITDLLRKLNPLALRATGFAMIMAIDIMGDPAARMVVGSIGDNMRQSLDIVKRIKENADK